MRDTIWKYSLGPGYRQTLGIPTGFKVRHVGPPSNTAMSAMGVCVWIEVDSKASKVPIDWFVVGTGHPLPPGGAIYCGTAVMADGYVWHVFCAVPIETIRETM